MTLLFMAGLFCVFLLLFWLYLRQERIIFDPDRIIRPVPKVPGVAIEDVSFRGSGGVLSGWYVTPENRTTDFVLLVCHGNRGNLTTPFRISFIQTLSLLGAEIFIFDYSGMGISEGDVSEKQACSDAMSAWSYLVEYRKVSPQKLIIFGRSLGGPIAAFLARERSASLLILESTFPSMASEVKALFPLLPAALIRFIVRSSFDTARYLEGLRLPVLFIHGDRDRLVPLSQGRKAYGYCPSPEKVFVEVPHGGHKAFQWERNAYLDALRSGLKSLGFTLQDKA